MERDATLEVLDFGQDLPADTPRNDYDVLILSDVNFGTYTSNPAEAIDRMCKVVKQDGTMCILATESILQRIQPGLDANRMETTVLHCADAGPSLIVSKRCLMPSTAETSNGATNGMTNGVANGTTNGTTKGMTEVATGTERMQITIIQAANPTEMALAVTSSLTAAFKEHDYETQVFSWGSDVSALAGKSCISLLEFQQPLLQDLSAQNFESVKKLLLETSKLFWVTALDDPAAAIIDGLVRVVRNETPGLNVRIFHADEQSSLFASPERLADTMAKTFLWVGEDNEFRVRDNLVHVCRVEEDTVLNDEINGLLPGAAKTITSLPLGDVKYPLKLCVRSPGMLSSVCLEPDESAETELEPDFIEIYTQATALK
jgi:zearalenone synthase (highly reducing iterative type I polyketide synthase)